MKGMFINEDGGVPYAYAIAQSYKTLETRTRNMLKQLVGERVAIVRTRHGKHPLIVGFVDVTLGMQFSREWLNNNRDKTLIPLGSKHDCKGAYKWGYLLENPEEVDAFPLPADAIRHGRSWCEF